MKDKRKLLRNFLLFLILIILTLWILLKDQDIFEILNIIKSAKGQFIAIGAICMSIYVICEAINMRRTLKALDEKTSFLQTVKYALIGFFFSSITPAASGGQPMQVYYMYKDKISVANSTLALLINLTSMQIITIGLALVSLIFSYTYLNKALVIFFVVGILLNISALILLLIGILSKRMSKGLINMAIKILSFLKVKNIEDKKKRFESELEKYQYSAVYIKNNKRIIIRTLLTTLIQFILYYSVTYWTYCALGLSNHNILEIITMQSVLFATVSGIPSPGAVGVTEGAFMEIFKTVFPKTMISSAVLLNRGINFYLLVIISGIVVIINEIKKKKINYEPIAENVMNKQIDEQKVQNTEEKFDTVMGNKEP